MATKRRKPTKFTTTGKITLTAVSVIGFIGGWNAIARLENQQAQASEATLSPLPVLTPAAAIPAAPTPWPTVSPLAALPPIPTLAPQFSTTDVQTGSQAVAGASPANRVQMAPLQLAPLPTLAPLPAVPQAPPPPPPLPPPPAGGWATSGGS